MEMRSPPVGQPLPGVEEAPAPGGFEPPSAAPKPWWRRALGAVVAAGVVILSYGAKLKGVLLLVTKLKFATTSLSMLVSIAAYTLIWTWKFAVGFVLLLLIHEMGHVWQLRREGVPASAPLFVPFLGAAVAMKELPRDTGAEARVGLAGPVLGTIGVLVPLGLYFATGDDLFRALTFMGFLLNLFNLAPVLPLDGGRALQALSPWITYLSFGGVVVLMLYVFTPVLLLVVVLGGLETWRRFKSRKSPDARRYNAVPLGTRAGVAATYLALVAVLAVGSYLAFLPATLDSI